MGTPQQSSKVQPSNLFSNPTDTTLKNSTCLRDPDSPSPRSSPLSWLTSSARRRLPGLSASSSCGPTSRRTTSRTPRTSSSSTPTRRWPRSSATTGSVLSVWPSTSALTSHKTFPPTSESALLFAHLLRLCLARSSSIPYIQKLKPSIIFLGLCRNHSLYAYVYLHERILIYLKFKNF